jgi:hypothetical protein
MAFDVINVGTAVNDGTGDTLRSGAQKVNANFAIAVEKTADDGAALLPVGDDLERPTPAVGMLRFNTDSGGFEGYDGSAWGAVGGAPAGYAFEGTRIFTTTGSFDKADPLGTGDIGLRAIRVRLVGGGGGGGGGASTSSNQGSAGGGGGGGAYGESFIDDMSTLSSTETVTVGTGGAGGATGANNGSAGATSSFGSLVTAGGGAGGLGQTAQATPAAGADGGAGSSTATADFLVRGGSGVPGIVFTSSGVRSTGGGTALGNPTNAERVGATRSNGETGQLFGCGGSGALVTQSQGSGMAGGAGAAGVVLVDCFV